MHTQTLEQPCEPALCRLHPDPLLGTASRQDLENSVLDGVCLVWTAAIVSKGAYHLQSTYEHDGEDKSGSLDKKAAMCCANSRSWSWSILRGGGAFAGRSRVLWRGWCANGRRATVDQQQSELVWRRIEAATSTRKVLCISPLCKTRLKIATGRLDLANWWLPS